MKLTYFHLILSMDKTSPLFVDVALALALRFAPPAPANSSLSQNHPLTPPPPHSPASVPTTTNTLDIHAPLSEPSRMHTKRDSWLFSNKTWYILICSFDRKAWRCRRQGFAERVNANVASALRWNNFWWQLLNISMDSSWAICLMFFKWLHERDALSISKGFLRQRPLVKSVGHQLSMTNLAV